MLEKNLYNEIWNRKTKDFKNSVPKEGRMFEALKVIGYGNILLDIGCGNGTFAKEALNNFNKVIGADISLKALKSIPQRAFPVFLTDFNNGVIPLADNCIDSVICLDVIEHVYDPFLLIREVYRVLKNEGEFIVTTPNTRFIKHVADLFLRGTSPKTNLDHEGYDGGHLHYFTFKDLVEILKEYDFDIVEKKGISIELYNSWKLRIFRFFFKFIERDVIREFFCQGILIKAKKKKILKKF